MSRFRQSALAACAGLGLAALSLVPASGQDLGPEGPLLGPRGTEGLPGLPGPKRGTVYQALGCHYARCLASDRSCVELHGRGSFRVCPQIFRRAR